MRERPQKQSLGEQLARFSLYVPVVILVLGFCTTGVTQRDRSVGVALFYLNVTLIVLGFLAGIGALVSMSRFGKSGILGRAIGGLLLNGLAIGALLAFLTPLVRTAQMRTALVGDWALVQAPDLNAKIDVHFDKDGRFRFTTDDALNSPAVFSGKWALTSNRVVAIKIEQVENGNQEMVGQSIGLGSIESVDQKQMVLKTDKGHETYQKR